MPAPHPNRPVWFERTKGLPSYRRSSRVPRLCGLAAPGAGERGQLGADHGRSTLGPCTKTPAKIGAVREPSASEVLRAMVAIFASGDPSEASTLVAEDYLDHQGLGDAPLRGVEGFSLVVRANRAAYEDQEVIIEDLFAEEDRAVARIRWRGRRQDGTDVDRQTIDIIRVASGRAIEHWGARV